MSASAETTKTDAAAKTCGCCCCPGCACDSCGCCESCAKAATESCC